MRARWIGAQLKLKQSVPMLLTSSNQNGGPNFYDLFGTVLHNSNVVWDMAFTF
jgi:hypothetical protein